MQNLRRIARRPGLCGALAFLERAFADLPESPVRDVVRGALAAGWDALAHPDRPTPPLTLEDARTLKSSRLYDEHVPGLLALSTPDRPSRERLALEATYELLCFLVLQLDAVDATTWPEKPNVLPSDVVECGSDELARFADVCVRGATEPAEQERFQAVVAAKLLEHYPHAGDPLGPLLHRAVLSLGELRTPRPPPPASKSVLEVLFCEFEADFLPSDGPPWGDVGREEALDRLVAYVESRILPATAGEAADTVRSIARGPGEPVYEEFVRKSRVDWQVDGRWPILRALLLDLAGRLDPDEGRPVQS